MGNKCIVLESPLAGDIARNYRYLLWCCRAVWLNDGAHAIGTHMLNPWFMDDGSAAERAAGMANPWAWRGDPHWFFVDLGMSGGMEAAFARCVLDKISHVRTTLADYAPTFWEEFNGGYWPPHTRGFEIAGASHPPEPMALPPGGWAGIKE